MTASGNSLHPSAPSRCRVRIVPSAATAPINAAPPAAAARPLPQNASLSTAEESMATNPNTAKEFTRAVGLVDQVAKARKATEPKYEDLKKRLAIAIKAKDGPKLELYRTAFEAMVSEIAKGSGLVDLALGSMREIEEACDVIFISGANTTETHPVFGALIKRAVAKGAKLIVADVRETELLHFHRLRFHLRHGLRAHRLRIVRIRQQLRDPCLDGEIELIPFQHVDEQALSGGKGRAT